MRQIKGPEKQNLDKRGTKPAEKQQKKGNSDQHKSGPDASKSANTTSDVQDLVGQLSALVQQMQVNMKSTHPNQWDSQKRKDPMPNTGVVQDNGFRRSTDYQSNRANNGICFVCDQYGHFAKNCPRKHLQGTRRNEGRFQQDFPTFSNRPPQSNSTLRSGEPAADPQTTSPVLTHSSSN